MWDTHTKSHIPGVAYSDSYVCWHHLAFRQEEANYPLPTIAANVSNLTGYSQNVFVFCVGGPDPESARRSFFLKSCLMKDSLISLPEIGLLLLSLFLIIMMHLSYPVILSTFHFARCITTLTGRDAINFYPIANLYLSVFDFVHQCCMCNSVVYLSYTCAGFELLYQPEVVRLYLSLLTESQNFNTLEAAAGALQNLSAGQWTVSVFSEHSCT